MEFQMSSCQRRCRAFLKLYYSLSLYYSLAWIRDGKLSERRRTRRSTASTTLLTPCALCRFFSKRITAFAVDREVGRSNRGLMDSVSSIVYHVYSPRIGCKEHGS